MKPTMRGPALTTLIATLFAVVAATTLAIAGLVLDRALGRQIAEQQERELIGTVAQVRHQLSERTSLAEKIGRAHV